MDRTITYGQLKRDDSACVYLPVLRWPSGGHDDKADSKILFKMVESACRHVYIKDVLPCFCGQLR